MVQDNHCQEYFDRIYLEVKLPKKRPPFKALPPIITIQNVLESPHGRHKCYCCLTVSPSPPLLPPTQKVLCRIGTR